MNVTTRRDVKSNIVGVVGVAQDLIESLKHDRVVELPWHCWLLHSPYLNPCDVIVGIINDGY